MLLARSYPALQATRAEACFCLSIFTLEPIAQSADNYFVYVISDLISTFANSAEYLRYGESFDVVAIKTEERIHILRIIHNWIYSTRDSWTVDQAISITLMP